METPKQKHTSAPRAPGKTYQKDGHWVEKPNKTVVLVCTCGNRYLKTRPGQNTCVRCMFK